MHELLNIEDVEIHRLPKRSYVCFVYGVPAARVFSVDWASPFVMSKKKSAGLSKVSIW